MLLDGLAPLVTGTGTVLDIAPSRYVTERITRMAPRRYVRMDLDPEADGRAVDVQASLTALPFAHDTFDLIVCFHVLEHIPDDARAMRELARVLRPGGLAIVQVPYARDQPTEEDPSAPPEERIRRFGQEDHVRRYGHDFEGRLADAGLAGVRIEAKDLVGERAARTFGMQPTSPMWLLRPTTAAGTPGVAPVPGHPSRTVIDLHDAIISRDAALARVQEQLRDAQSEAVRYRDSYRRLRDHPAIGAAIVVSRPLRRFARRVRRRVVRR